MRAHLLVAMGLAAAVVVACGPETPPAGSANPGPSADAGTVSDAGPGSSPDAGSGGGVDAGPGDQDGGSGGGGGDQDGGSGGGGGGGGSAPVALTTSESAAALALDAVNVYWVNNSSRDPASSNLQVRKMPKSGGTPATIFESRGMGAFIVSDGEAVYFTAAGCSSSGPCSSLLVRAAADGSGGAALGPGNGLPAVDEQFVYVATPPHPAQSDQSMVADLVKQPKRGGPATVLDSIGEGAGSAVGLFGGEAFWSITWHDSETFGAIRAVPIAGGTSRVVSSRQNMFPSGIKVDSDWVYFRSFQGGVERAPRTGGQAELLWKGPNGADIDANARVVYWNQSHTDQFPGCVGRANSDGTDGRCLDHGPNDFAGVRVDDTAVYYIKDGQIWRTGK